MKKLGEHALCAKAIKKELKETFSKTKFSVKSDKFAGGSSVRIEWKNGVTYKQAKSVTSKYQYDFSGDLKNNLPKVRFINLSRSVEESQVEIIFNWLKENDSDFKEIQSLTSYNETLKAKYDACNAVSYIYTIIHKLNLSNGVSMT